MAKPIRSFSADVNQFSTGAAGPDQIEYDLDNLFAMLDPGAKLKDGTTAGGISNENLKDNTLTDNKMAELTLDQEQLPVDTGKIGRLLSGIVNAIRGLKGTTDWKDRAVTTFQYLLTFKADVGHTHGNPVDGHTHDEFKALDILGVSRQIVTNMTITRDTKNRITQMDYTTSEDTGSIVFHRNTSGKLDCTRLSSLILSNLHTTQVQIELIRDNSGAVTSIFRSGFNAVLQSGLVWPIT